MKVTMKTVDGAWHTLKFVIQDGVTMERFKMDFSIQWEHMAPDALLPILGEPHSYIQKRNIVEVCIEE